MNVTPMIDVLLVLIIVFMIINTASTSTGLDGVAPKPPIKNGEVQPRTVVIQLAEAQGGQPTLTINQEPVSWGAAGAADRCVQNAGRARAVCEGGQRC